MTADFSQLASSIKRLDRAVQRVATDAERLGIASPESEEWHALLHRKLTHQASDSPWLIVALVGGTNIGKSALFNTLAGESASAVSPTAAGTRHPVCLVPDHLDDFDFLSELFEGFTLRPWRDGKDALSTSEEHMLFRRVGPNLPERLLLLDTPDLDSDVRVNWRRARAVRQAADVLIAVLTQQKYNDAAVKQFFREAAEADKPVIIVFNQCDLKADQEHWPLWLDTFLQETGCRPELVGVAPWDRTAADAGRLTVHNVGLDGRGVSKDGSGSIDENYPPLCLREYLASLEFDAIKTRALRGSLRRVLDAQRGAPDFLNRVSKEADRYADAGRILASSEMARVDWPTLTTQVLVQEIRDWWDVHRADWSRKIHGAYRKIGRAVAFPLRYGWKQYRATSSDAASSFHAKELQAVLTTIERLYAELERLAEIGNETLKPRLLHLLEGQGRESVLERVRVAYEELPDVDEDYRIYLRQELDTWREESPRFVRILKALDHAGAVARPAITISLAVSGFMFAGDIVGQATAHLASEIATEAAIAGGITGGGELVVGTAGEGIRQAAARLFHRLQSEYARQRADWLARWIDQELLGELLEELGVAALVSRSDAFLESEEMIASLASLSGVTAE
jgi:hypothetical protein